ncbi:hypothetical protein [Microcoleus sp. D3_18_C4]|uniref:hypothetical protein n=1 Tax=Microcoleus sp. D3_18_C4 TaxID=3055335 RepID=UPI002FD2EF23
MAQRVERAKQLLKFSRAIMGIAFECGFNSHSYSQHTVSAIYGHDTESQSDRIERSCFLQYALLAF